MKTILLHIFLLISVNLISQTYNVGDQNLMYFNSGNVGVGISSPERAMHIQSANAVFRIDRDRPSATLIMTQWAENFTSIYKSFTIGVTATELNNGYFRIADYGTAVSGSSINRFVIANNGNIGIGTDNPASKLSVNGRVESTEVQVKATIADYVFDDKYSLRSIEDLDKFIKENKHLPNVYSAKDQVENRGFIPLGEISMNMLEKIEELTLYIIQMNKEIKKLNDRIIILEKKLN